MPMKIANRDARRFVQRLHPFEGNNLYGNNWCSNPSSGDPGDSGYVVYSYRPDWPLFVCIHLDGRDRWFENRERYSVTTSKHRTQAHPLPPEGTTLMSREDINTLVRKGLTYLTALKLDPPATQTEFHREHA